MKSHHSSLPVRSSVRKAVAALLLTFLAVAAGCRHSDGGSPTISVSFPMQETLVREIVGQGISINTLITPGVDPETFDPSMQTLSELNGSRAYFTLGTPGFEQNLVSKAAGSLKGVEIIDTSKGIRIIDGTHGGHEADPHVGTSLKNAVIIAGNIAESLCRLFPDSARTYRENAARLQSGLRQLDDSVSQILKSEKGAAFVVMHPSLSYFARDYGLRQIAMETEGKEATPRQLQQRMQMARDAGARVMICERGHAPAQSRELARQMGLKLLEVSLNGPEWQRELLRIAEAIAQD